MKRSTLAFFLLLGLMPAWAGVYEIGGGTSNTNKAPLNGNADYSWSKMIYTVAELNAAGLSGAREIAGLGFQLQNRISYDRYLAQRVFLRHTSASAYGGGNEYPDSTGATLVYAGPVTFHGSGWQQLAFSQTFLWNGSGNIEILWLNHHGSSREEYPKFYYSSGADQRLVYASGGSSFPTGPGTKVTWRLNLQLVTPMLPSAALAVYPATGGLAFEGSELLWQSGGGCPTSYDVYFGESNPPPRVSTGQTDDHYLPETLPGRSYFWKVVPANDQGSPASVPVWSFRAPSSGQLCESFEAWPPQGWANPGGWSSSEVFPYHGEAGAWTFVSTGGILLATPKLLISPGSRLEFHALASNPDAGSGLRIRYSSDGNTWSQLGEALSFASSNVWQRYVVDLGALAGQSLYLGLEGFKTGEASAMVWLDHVAGPPRASDYPAPSLSISWQGGGFLLEWTPASGAQGYRIYEAADPQSFGAVPLAEVGAGVFSHAVSAGERKFFRVTAVY